MRALAISILALGLAACQAAAPATETPAAPTQQPTQPPTQPPSVSPSASPVTSAAGSGLIVFQRTDDGVYTVAPSGGAETRILPGSYQTPRWSPSGDQLALSHIIDDAHGVVVPAIAEPDGSGVHDLTLGQAGLHCGASVWSPDGAWLAAECWDEQDDAKTGIYRMQAADGGDLRQLTVGHGIPGDISDDGTQLVFVDADGRLGLVGVDGSGERRLGDAAIGLYPGFMPGGASIYATLDGVLTILDLDGAVVEQVKAPEPQMYEPRLDPEGTTFVFTYDPQKVKSPGLARIGTDGQGFADILLAAPGQAENVSADWRR